MVKVIKHKDIDQETLLEIAKIKQFSWNYSVDDHLQWITNNIRGDDYHLLLFDDKEFVAYMNLVEVVINEESTLIPFLGIGNVCAKYKGRGDGKKLMHNVNTFLKKNDFHGILFCKKELVDFYMKFDWQLINNLYPNDKIFTMIYNYTKDYSNFSYDDRLF